jgi:hypothetical protein
MAVHGPAIEEVALLKFLLGQDPSWNFTTGVLAG